METLRAEQVKLLKKPFEEKKAYKDLNLSAGTSYPVILVRSLSCSVDDVLASPSNNSLRLTMEQFVLTVSEVAKVLANILAEKMDGERICSKKNGSKAAAITVSTDTRHVRLIVI